jgi:WD40 repeat protein
VPPRPLNADDPLLPRGLTGRCDDAEPDALIVMQVAKGSPACQAGLQPDDRICQINGLAFSLDSKRLATGSFDKSVRIWDVATGTEKARLEAESPVYSV